MDMGKYAKEQIEKVKDSRRKVAFALYNSVVQKTPKDTGRAQANWQIETTQSGSVSDELELKHKKLEDVPLVDGDGSYYITNNLPYITTLEYGGYPDPPKNGTGKTVGGFSKRAPQGMVGVTMANSKAIVDAVLRGNK